MSKFKKQDEFYLRERKKLSNDLGKQELFDIADQFGLYAGTQTIGRSLFIYEILKETINIPGDIVEFGCWKGSNLLFMAKVLSLLQPNSIKQVYAFDSFEGLQTFADEDGEGIKETFKNKYKGDQEVIRKCLQTYEMENWVTLVVGDALKTIGEFEEENKHVMFSLAYIDFDLYAPCLKALEFSHRNLNLGGFIILDEALTTEWKGEGQALKEFLEKNEGNYEMISNHISKQPTVVLKRVK
jgi:hypothetical protein